MLRSAARNLWIGLFFIFIDVRIDTFDVIPDIVGYGLILAATFALAPLHPAFRWARRWAWVILASQIFGLLKLSWFEVFGIASDFVPGGGWRIVDSLVRLLPDIAEIGLYAALSSGLIVYLNTYGAAEQARSLRAHRNIYIGLGGLLFGMVLVLARSGQPLKINLLNTTSAIALPLLIIVILALLAFLALLWQIRQAFKTLPADVAPLQPPAPLHWHPVLRRHRRWLIGGSIPLVVWLIWAMVFNVPAAAPIVQRLPGDRGAGETGANATFSPDGTRIAVSDINGPLRIFDAQTGALLLTAASGHVKDVAYSPDGSRIATVGLKTYILDAATGAEILRTPPGQEDSNDIFGWQDTVLWNPDGRSIATSSSFMSIISIIDPANAATLTTINRSITTNNQASSIAYSPDGTRIAMSRDNGQVVIWEVQTGRQERLLTLADDPFYLVRGVAWSLDGRLIATANDHNTATLWDAATGQKVRSFATSSLFDQLLGRRPHSSFRNWASSIAFSPDGTLVAVGSSDASAGVWQVRTGRQILALNGHSDDINSISFSPDGQQILTGSSDGTVLVWDVAQAYR